MCKVTHLHNHSKYSTLDGVITTQWLFPKLKELGMDTFAITDHGSISGLPEFSAAGTEHGIKIIAGIEIYEVDNIACKTAEEVSSTQESCKIEETKVEERENKGETYSKKEAKYWHLTLLAKNHEGYKQLIKLTAAANTKDAYYYKPRVDRSMLESIIKGGNVVIGTGCALSRISRYALDKDDYSGYSDRIDYYAKIFGIENIMCEIMANGFDGQKVINEKLISWANQKGVPIVTTNDCHYVDKEHARLQDILLCISTNQFADDQNRKFKFEGTSYYIRSATEMKQAFLDQYNIDVEKPGWLSNTIDFANMCEHASYINDPQFRLPKFSIPKDEKFSNWIQKNRERLEDKGYEINSLIQAINR
jgi:DNA polymerase-3 subunit alpha